MDDERLTSWANAYPFVAIDIDCIIAVMLKILDGKCKMGAEEKRIMETLYNLVGQRSNRLLPAQETHELISIARNKLNEDMKKRVYEQRLLAETIISRPVMKKFKAMLKQNGVIGSR